MEEPHRVRYSECRRIHPAAAERQRRKTAVPLSDSLDQLFRITGCRSLTWLPTASCICPLSLPPADDRGSLTGSQAHIETSHRYHPEEGNRILSHCWKTPADPAIPPAQWCSTNSRSRWQPLLLETAGGSALGLLKIWIGLKLSTNPGCIIAHTCWNALKKSRTMGRCSSRTPSAIWLLPAMVFLRMHWSTCFHEISRSIPGSSRGASTSPRICCS